MVQVVPQFRIQECAELLGVSDDTVRRWVAAGQLRATSLDGRRAVDGRDLAAFARARAVAEAGSTSARNRFSGIVTRVQSDGVMAQVELAARGFRVVSLMSREAVEDLGLEPGVRATASVKATMVTVGADPT
jgi:molybdopterin-binding protein